MTSKPNAGADHARGHTAVETLRTTPEGHHLADAIDRVLAIRAQRQHAADNTPITERLR